jgi:hypothetical protein
MITDDPQREGFDNYYGIWVAVIGEDSETMVALGHHNLRHALAAFNACARRLLGWTDLYDGLLSRDPEKWQAVWNSLESAWAVQKYACDEAEEADHDPDCMECSEIKEAGWWLTWDANSQTAGAFPVVIWRA